MSISNSTKKILFFLYNIKEKQKNPATFRFSFILLNNFFFSLQGLAALWGFLAVCQYSGL